MRSHYDELYAKAYEAMDGDGARLDVALGHAIASELLFLYCLQHDIYVDQLRLPEDESLLEPHLEKAITRAARWVAQRREGHPLLHLWRVYRYRPQQGRPKPRHWLEYRGQIEEYTRETLERPEPLHVS
jgi:hypothetical protein